MLVVSLSHTRVSRAQPVHDTKNKTKPERWTEWSAKAKAWGSGSPRPADPCNTKGVARGKQNEMKEQRYSKVAMPCHFDARWRLQDLTVCWLFSLMHQHASLFNHWSCLYYVPWLTLQCVHIVTAYSNTPMRVETQHIAFTVLALNYGMAKINYIRDRSRSIRVR